MTEQEWLACADAEPMLAFLDVRWEGRKLQLFACACCRRLHRLFPNAVSQQAIEFSEQNADWLAGDQDWVEAQAAVSCYWMLSQRAHATRDALTQGEMRAVRAASELTRRWPKARGRARLAVDVARRAARAVLAAANDPRAVRLAPAGQEVRVARATWQAAEAAGRREQQAQAALLRDIFGPLPFRPPPPLPPAVLAWNDDTVRRLAQAIYDERQLPAGTLDTARLGVLANALLDAGCEDDEVVRHLREPGPHVRGCWVVDVILGKPSRSAAAAASDAGRP
jgi:hypothetical protein